MSVDPASQRTGTWVRALLSASVPASLSCRLSSVSAILLQRPSVSLPPVCLSVPRSPPAFGANKWRQQRVQWSGFAQAKSVDERDCSGS